MSMKKTLKKYRSEAKRRLTVKGSEKGRLVSLYYKTMKTKPINEKMVLFEAYQASRMSCNPLAIFEYMKKDPEFADFTFVWVLSEKDNFYANEYKKDKKFIVVPPHSKKFVKYLAVAKYIVNNKTFPYYFVKREGQVHISTWHGIPLKTLGKQQLGSMGQYRNVARNYVHTDYLVMPDKFTADIMLECTDLQSRYQGQIIDAGYPRVDFTLNTDYNEMRQFLKDLLQIDISKKIVLYAPTWRGEVGKAKDTTDIILDNLLALSEGLPEEYELLLKIHDRTYVYVKDNPRLSEMKNVPDFIDTNKLLAAIDVLITDYSSIYFEFMCLRRPILFFVYDREEYESTRGLYFSLDTEVPGPLCYTAEEVNERLASIEQVQKEYHDVYEKIFQELCYNDDGHATERVMNIIFHNKDTQYAYRLPELKKIRTLLYLGNLAKNPISESVIEQINMLDPEKYDINVIYNGKPNRKNERYLKQLAEFVRVVYRVPMPISKQRNYYIKKTYDTREGFGARFVTDEAVNAYRYHYFGNEEFDLCIDFAGTPSIWNLIFARTNFKKKVVFMNKRYSSKLIKKAYAKRYFDELICVKKSTYDAYSEGFDELEGKGVLRYLPVPTKMGMCLDKVNDSALKALSYTNFMFSEVAKGEHKVRYHIDQDENYEENVKKVEKAMETLDDLRKMDDEFADVYEKCKKEFHTIFQLPSEEGGR